MATANPFDLLGDNDNDDPSQLIAAAEQLKLAPASKKVHFPPQAPAAAFKGSKPATAKLPSKPLPPVQSVREARDENQRGGRAGGHGGGGRGRGGRGFIRDFTGKENLSGRNNGFLGGSPYKNGESKNPSERRGNGGQHGGFRGPRRGGFNNGEVEEQYPRRTFERHSGTGHGNEFKRDGSGHGNWGTPSDDLTTGSQELVNDNESNADGEKQLGQDDSGDANKEVPASEPEAKKPDDNEMTLEEYEKVLEEKRKALIALKTSERKVILDKEFETMKVLSNKKSDDGDFIKLGSEKDKRKETEKEEKAKKAVSINEFLKPAEGETYSRSGGRGQRGGGRGSRGHGGGNFRSYISEAPLITDEGHFPSLGSK